MRRPSTRRRKDERPGLGRKRKVDRRDANYPVRAMVPRNIRLPERRYWWASGAWYDQGATGTCVGHAWAHWAEDSPVTHPDDIVDPMKVYAEACLQDPWSENDGPDWDFGTTVRAGAKACRARGYVDEFFWAQSFQDVIDTLGLVGPMVLGIDWFNAMFNPVRRTDSAGISRLFLDVDRSSGIAGGHAILADGIHIPGKAVRLKNSWGRGWGANGFVSIAFEDLEYLLFDRGGEACIAREIRRVA